MFKVQLFSDRQRTEEFMDVSEPFTWLRRLQGPGRVEIYVQGGIGYCAAIYSWITDGCGGGSWVSVIPINKEAK